MERYYIFTDRKPHANSPQSIYSCKRKIQARTYPMQLQINVLLTKTQTYRSMEPDGEYNEPFHLWSIGFERGTRQFHGKIVFSIGSAGIIIKYSYAKK